MNKEQRRKRAKKDAEQRRKREEKRQKPEQAKKQMDRVEAKLDYLITLLEGEE